MKLGYLTLLSVLTLTAALAAPAVKIAQAPLPAQLGESIRAVLQPTAIELTDGNKALLQLWLRKELPLKSGTAELASIPEAALAGAISVQGESLRDYKDNEIPKGTYTARFALQPQDGDHLGTAEFNYFLVLVAAENDKDLAAIDKYRPLVKASGKSTPSGHPIVISLRPVSSAHAQTPAVIEPVAEHKAVRLKIPAKSDSGDKKDLVFDLVFEGHGHIQ